MEAHARDLQAQAKDEAWVGHIKHDYGRAALTPVDRALCEYASKLTRSPAEVTSADVEKLRQAGLSDEAILDACEVVSYFNYINRIADGLGVDPEDFMAAPSAGP